MEPRPFGNTSARFYDPQDQEDDGDEEKKIDFFDGFDALFREQTPHDMLFFSSDKHPFPVQNLPYS